MGEVLLTLDEVAARLGLGRRTVQGLVAEKKLTPLRPTGRRAVRYSSLEVERLIEGVRPRLHETRA